MLVMSCVSLYFNENVPRGESVVAVEEHEQREDQRCQEMRKLEPLVTHRSV
jgi:hypothetical protein